MMIEHAHGQPEGPPPPVIETLSNHSVSFAKVPVQLEVSLVLGHPSRLKDRFGSLVDQPTKGTEHFGLNLAEGLPGLFGNGTHRNCSRVTLPALLSAIHATALVDVYSQLALPPSGRHPRQQPHQRGELNR